MQFFLISLLLIFSSFTATANVPSNCSSCKSQVGEEIGTVSPKDKIFHAGSISVTCPRDKNGTYKSGASWTSTFTGFYNDNYMWFYQARPKTVRIIFGYKKDNNLVRIEGVDIWLPKKTKYSYFGIHKLNKPNGTMWDVLEENLEIKRSNSFSNRLCRAKGYLNYVSRDFTGEGRLRNSIRNLKSFERTQYDIINKLTKHGFKIGLRFELTDAISDLSVELAQMQIRNKSPKIIVKEDLESKKLAEQRAQELEKERARLQSLLEEKKRLETKARQLEKSNRLSEIEAKKRSEELAKEIAAQEREKLAKERELRRIESQARLKAEEKAKKIAKERALAERKIKELAEKNRLAELKVKKRSEELAKEIATQEREKLAKERELRRIETEARLKAEENARKIAKERALAQAKAKKLAEEQKKAEKLARQLELERTVLEKENEERLKNLEEERKKSDQLARKLMKETELAKKKAKELTKKQQNQLAAIQQERDKFIQEEKRKREELEKKLIELRAQNKKQQSQSKMIETIKLPPEWIPYRNDMSLQQKQFCQLTNRFFNDLNKAYKSKNDIKVNIVHRDRQENLDGLVPGGKINNWIFKVEKIDQVEDGSAAVVLSLQCDSYVGSGQIYTKSTWLKRSNKEWRATIPYEDRRFRELAKLDGGQFVLASGTLLEVEAFKPGQIETFYASQQIGEHPLTKGLNLEGELFIADLSYIAALN